MKKSNMKKGKVISIRRNEIHVFSEDGAVICTIKKSLFKDIKNQKNIITVGDNVCFNEAFQITSIDERSSLLERVDPLNKRKKQLIGANIDRVYITFAICSPKIDIVMLDRYIMAANHGNIEPVIVLNKIDLSDDDDFIKDIIELYEELSIEVFPISCKDDAGMNKLIASLKGRSSIFCGPSGVGKTSIINTITNADHEVGEISEKIQKGKHTTTFSSLYPLDKDTFIIDTPGIASFNLFKMSLEDILGYFSDLNVLGSCKFSNCTHSHEPSCMVKEAKEQNLLSPIRFSAFEKISQNIE